MPWCQINVHFMLCRWGDDITSNQYWVIVSLLIVQWGWGVEGDIMAYQDLSFPNDAVCAVSVFFVQLGPVVALLVAEQPQGLRALQLDLKLLWTKGQKIRNFFAWKLGQCNSYQDYPFAEHSWSTFLSVMQGNALHMVCTLLWDPHCQLI